MMSDSLEVTLQMAVSHLVVTGDPLQVFLISEPPLQAPYFVYLYFFQFQCIYLGHRGVWRSGDRL